MEKVFVHNYIDGKRLYLSDKELKKRRTNVNIGLRDYSIFSKLYNYLDNVLDTDIAYYIRENKENTYIVQVNKIGFIYILEKEGKLGNLPNIVYGGKWIGVVIDNDVCPSINLYEQVFSTKGYRASIIVNEEGVKNFLYGNDIFASSIEEYYEPINYCVAVIDYFDKRVIGIAKPVETISLDELHKLLEEKQAIPVFKNVFDLGFFLRVLK